jgi:hypothetical protein
MLATGGTDPSVTVGPKLAAWEAGCGASAQAAAAQFGPGDPLGAMNAMNQACRITYPRSNTVLYAGMGVLGLGLAYALFRRR